MDIENLCKIMYDQGYTHASFINVNTDYTARFIEELEISNKPTKGFNFSKLEQEDVYDDQTDEVVGQRIVPAWYSWINFEDFNVDSYSNRDILFIKADKARMKLVDQTDPPFITGKYIFSMAQYGITQIDWRKAQQDGYYGVRVENPYLNKFWSDKAFDVPTISIWDLRALNPSNSKTYINAGYFKYKDNDDDLQDMIQKMAIKDDQQDTAASSSRDNHTAARGSNTDNLENTFQTLENLINSLHQRISILERRHR